MARAEVIITATDRTQSALNSAQRGLGGLQKSAVAASSALKSAFGIIGVAAVGAFVVRVSQAADQLQDLADNIGVSASSLSTLKLAAAQSGTSLDAVALAMQKMSQTIGDAASGSKQAQQAFSTLGINVREIANLRPDEAFSRVADAISRIENPYRRAAAAQDIFGKGAKDLQALLKEGSAALTESRAQLEAHGAALSDIDISRIAAMNDQFAAQSTIVGNLATKMLANFAPAIDVAVGAFSALMESMGGSDRVGRALGVTFIAFMKAVQSAGSGILSVFELIRSVITKLVAFTLRGVEMLTSGFAKLVLLAERLVGGNVGNDIAAAAASIGGLAQSFDEASASAAKNAVDFGFSAGRAARDIFAAADIYDAAAGRLDAAARRRLGQNMTVGATDVASATTAKSASRALRQIKVTPPKLDNDLTDGLVDSIMKSYEQRFGQQFATLTAFAEEAAKSMQSAFADFLFDPFENGVKGMLAGFLNVIRRMISELLAQQILTAFFSAFSGGTGILGQFASAALAGLKPRAKGGPVTANSPYLVGERGPELFVPSTAGTVVPNHKMAEDFVPATTGIMQPMDRFGAGMTVAPVYNIDARGATMELTQALPSILADNNRRIFDELDRRYGIRR